jgi:eight-cysteine-cluster-containing protein
MNFKEGLIISAFFFVFLTGFAMAITENATTSINEFCGGSTNAPCLGNGDCKAGGCSGQVCGSINESTVTTCEYTECYNAASYGLTCGCSENKCKWIETTKIILSNCAKEGEQFSKVYPEYPENCCAGLTEWNSGMDTRKVVNGTCVQTNLVSGSPVGTCINCGNGICEKIENVCNCPEDCDTIICAKEGELCAGIANITCCEGLNCITGDSLGTSGKCVNFNKTKECITNEDCGPQGTCPDGTSYYLQLCRNKTCEGISFTGGTPCFNENGEILDINQTKKRIEERNRLRINVQNQSECPENCTCSGSTVKCMMNRQREMTITAGKSGNVIVQMKGENMSTNVTLYKANGKIYGVFKDNETKEVKMMPDQVAEKIKERLQQREEEYNITLDENGMYEVQTKKKAKLFYLFPVKEKTQLELSSESGEIIRVRNPWWGFLAKDTEEQPLVGSSCGTVTPGYNDECCQNKGYNYWNATSSECEFNSE